MHNFTVVGSTLLAMAMETKKEIQRLSFETCSFEYQTSGHCKNLLISGFHPDTHERNCWLQHFDDPVVRSSYPDLNDNDTDSSSSQLSVTNISLALWARVWRNASKMKICQGVYYARVFLTHVKECRWSTYVDFVGLLLDVVLVIGRSSVRLVGRR